MEPYFQITTIIFYDTFHFATAGNSPLTRRKSRDRISVADIARLYGFLVDSLAINATIILKKEVWSTSFPRTLVMNVQNALRRNKPYHHVWVMGHALGFRE